MATQFSPFRNPATPFHFVKERTWQDIVEEASRERDAEKIRQLSEELERVLEERAEKLRAESVPQAKQQSA